MSALPVGTGRDRLRLFDNQWLALWDSAVDTTPAYRHIAHWARACIDYADGSRWVGEMYRCPEGIKRETYPPLLEWPTFEAVS